MPLPPLPFAPALGIFGYFAESNLAGKVIVVLLSIFSLLAWTVMIGKYIDLNNLRQQNLRFERSLEQNSSLLSLQVNASVRSLGPYAVCVADAIDAASRTIKGKDAARLRMGHVENAIQRAVANQTMRYEDKMITLGSIVTGAPFLGLLGTVWGVMDAFGGMGTQQTATIQSLAPGVSGALLTTVAGLIVAIPSVFGYNFLLSTSRRLVTELENFSSRLADHIELDIEMEAES